MTNDAVIIEVEIHLHSLYEPFGHFVCLRFVDSTPSHNKLQQLIKDMSQYPDVKLIDYNYTVKPITEATDISGLEITKH